MDATATASAPNYKKIWKAWAALLVITVAMVFLPHNLWTIMIGILFKVVIIAGIFMDLKDETLDFVMIVGFNVLFFAILLYALMVPDGLVM